MFPFRKETPMKINPTENFLYGKLSFKKLTSSKLVPYTFHSLEKIVHSKTAHEKSPRGSFPSKKTNLIEI